MLKYIPDMINIGICSLKVEGRMRSIYYVATVISTYRHVIDEYYSGTLTSDRIEYYMKVLNRVANRDNVVQFYDKFPGVNEQYFLGREETTNQDYLAIVDSYDKESGYVTVTQKNYFKPGDIVEIISPYRKNMKMVIPKIYNNDMEELEVARHPEEIIKFKIDFLVSKYDMIRTLIK